MKLSDPITGPALIAHGFKLVDDEGDVKVFWGNNFKVIVGKSIGAQVFVVDFTGDAYFPYCKTIADLRTLFKLIHNESLQTQEQVPQLDEALTMLCGWVGTGIKIALAANRPEIVLALKIIEDQLRDLASKEKGE